MSTAFKAYAILKVAPINAHWEVTIYHNVTGVEMSTDQDGHVCKLITTDGWRKLHSPFPIQVCRSAADLDRMTPPIT